MENGLAAIGVLTEYWSAWHLVFPRLHRRAQWHIVHHLCSRAPAGASLGELSGLTRHALLLDDSTVRERVQDLAEAGDCALEPAGVTLGARSIVVPTPALAARYDRTLQLLLASLRAAAPTLAPGLRLPATDGLTPDLREVALETLEVLVSGWAALLEQLFEAPGLSSARRSLARRHLLSTSQRTLLLTVIAEAFNPPPLHGAAPAQAGILADRLAASLLELTGQNFQTTRDHIANLLALGLLRRCPGRALRVALAEAAVEPARAALAEIEAALAAIVRRHGTPSSGTFALRIAGPGQAARVVALDAWPFTIGRAEENRLHLAAGEVSRVHCEMTLRDRLVTIADMHSTNGTSVDGVALTAPVPLHDGALIRIGPFELTFLAPDDLPESTLRPNRQRRLALG